MSILSRGDPDVQHGVTMPINNDEPVLVHVDHGTPGLRDFAFVADKPGWESVVRIQRLRNGTRQLVVEHRKLPA